MKKKNTTRIKNHANKLHKNGKKRRLKKIFDNLSFSFPIMSDIYSISLAANIQIFLNIHFLFVMNNFF